MEHLKIPLKWKMRASPSGNRLEKIHYTSYKMTPGEELQCCLEGAAIVGLFAYFFYRSVIAAVLLAPGIYWYRKRRQQGLRKKRKENLEKQFREMLLSVNVNLQTGYSIENAFLESYGEIEGQFGPESDMAKELRIIKKGLANRVPIENLLSDFGNRCGEGEIKEFAEVFHIARHTGGKWNEVMQKTVDMIQRKLEMKEEIKILIHAKKLESRIMCMVPFFILAYVDVTSGGYFQVLYHNLLGILVMTLCLVFYGLAFCLGEKITAIELV